MIKKSSLTTASCICLQLYLFHSFFTPIISSDPHNNPDWLGGVHTGVFSLGITFCSQRRRQKLPIGKTTLKDTLEDNTLLKTSIPSFNKCDTALEEGTDSLIKNLIGQLVVLRGYVVGKIDILTFYTYTHICEHKPHMYVYIY